MMRTALTFLLALSVFTVSAQDKQWTNQEIATELCHCYEDRGAEGGMEKWNECFMTFFSQHNEAIMEKCSRFPSASMISDCKTEMLAQTIRYCDIFNAEMQAKYAGSYPQLSGDSIEKVIGNYTKKLSKSKQDDSTKRYLHHLAYLSIQTKNYDAALDYIDKWITSGAKGTTPLEIQAYVYYMTGQTDKALLSIQGAMQLAPKENYKITEEIIRRKK